MEKLDLFFKSKGYENFKDFQNKYIDNPGAYDLDVLFKEYADYCAKN